MQLTKSIQEKVTENDVNDSSVEFEVKQKRKSYFGLTQIVAWTVFITLAVASAFNYDITERDKGKQCGENCERNAEKLNGHEYNGNYEEAECQISIPAACEPLACQRDRNESISRSRQFYKLTVTGEKPTIEFPFSSFIPFLNQTISAVRYHTANDPIDSKWAIPLYKFKAAIENGVLKSNHMFSFDHTDHYKEAYNTHNEDISNMRASEYLSNPATDSTFTDIIQNDRWKSDDIFTQQRLAGACPFLIKLVTVEGYTGTKASSLKQLLNKTYDFDAAVMRALASTNKKEITLDAAIRNEILYVLYHEEHNDMRTTAHQNNTSSHKHEEIASPITLFVRTRGGELKVVAIQWNYKPESPVFSPASDSMEWTLAKSMVNFADTNYCQAVWHLSHAHLSAHVYCTIFRSHFSERHPIHQIMRHHCQGTVPHVALAWTALVAPGGASDRFYSIGCHGYVELVAKGKNQYRYGILAYDEVLKAHGLDSNKLAYHPFRDDGEVLWNEFQMFASTFVNMFYETDDAVMNDNELQSYANEVSADGKKEPFGGRGRIGGLPSSFNSKKELKVFVTRFIWLVAMHAALNYPIEPWYTFVPLSPPKLYTDEKMYNLQNIAYAYPDAEVTVGGIKFATLLGNLRINRIMDHFNLIKHNKLSTLIQYHHRRLHSSIQQQLETRNADRKAKQLMGFQYFEPKWLTNSIHI